MFCSKCGFENPEGSRFCKSCGAPADAPAASPQPAAPPRQPPYQPAYQPPYQPPSGAPFAGLQTPKKKKPGLIIGLVSGAVVLIGAAVALYLLVFAGTPVAGQWYCEERGNVLVFEGGGVTGYSLTGTIDGDYDYDKNSGAGTIDADGFDLSFTVKNDKMALTNEASDSKSTYVRLKEARDPEELVLGALTGLWSSQEAGAVLELNDGGIVVHTADGSLKGRYDYDIDKGSGSYTADGVTYAFTADYSWLVLENGAVYQKSKKSLDIDAFVSEFSLPIAGLWYETTGVIGTIEFFSGGTAEMIYNGMSVPMSFTFNAASGAGMLTSDMLDPLSLTYADGTLVIDGYTFTRDVVPQLSADDLENDVLGRWYEITGTLGDITFYDDGSLALTYDNTFDSGTYTYDSVSGTGRITMDHDPSADWSFYAADGILVIGDTTYTRDAAAANIPAGGILGSWYDVTGVSGVIIFFDDGTLFLTSYGDIYTGGYAFDDETKTGTLSVTNYNDNSSYDLDMYIGPEGNLYIGEMEYTLSYVSQQY